MLLIFLLVVCDLVSCYELQSKILSFSFCETALCLFSEPTFLLLSLYFPLSFIFFSFCLCYNYTVSVCVSCPAPLFLIGGIGTVDRRRLAELKKSGRWFSLVATRVWLSLPRTLNREERRLNGFSRKILPNQLIFLSLAFSFKKIVLSINSSFIFHPPLSPFLIYSS